MSRPPFTLTTPSECGKQPLTKWDSPRALVDRSKRPWEFARANFRSLKCRSGVERLSLAGAIGTVTLTLWVWCALQLLQG